MPLYELSLFRRSVLLLLLLLPAIATYNNGLVIESYFQAEMKATGHMIL